MTEHGANDGGEAARAPSAESSAPPAGGDAGAVRAPANPPPAPAGPPAGGEVRLTCGWHAQSPAVALCALCGAALCPECRTVGTDGRSRCPECVIAPPVAPPGRRAAPPSRPGESAPAAIAADRPEPAAAGPPELPAEPESGGIPAGPLGPAAPSAAPEAARLAAGAPGPAARPDASAPPAPEAAGAGFRPVDAAGRPLLGPAADAARLAAGIPFGGLAPIPWEHPERHGALAALWLTLVAVVRNPLQAVVRIPWEERDFVAPLVLSVTAGIVSQLGILLGAFLFADLGALLGPQFAQLGVSPVAGTLLGLTALPLTLALRLFVASFVSHTLLGFVGGARRPYEATYRVFAYAGVASLLGLVPAIGPPAAAVLTLIVVLLGLRVAHGATSGQALVAALPQFLGVIFEAGL